MTLLWLSVGGSVLFAMPLVAGKIALVGVATAVSAYLIRRGPGTGSPASLC